MMSISPPDTGMRPPRRIAIGLAGLQLGGCQINAIDLARTLRDRGNEVRVFAIRDDSVRSTILPYAERAGFTVSLLPRKAGAFETAAAIAEFTRLHDSAVVHVFAPWLNRPAAIAASMDRNVAIVETNWNMENMFWGSSSVPLIVGTGAMLDEALPRRRASVHLMEPPIDTATDRPDAESGVAFRAEHAIGSDAVLAVIVSRVDRAMKLEGILDAIDAVERLDDPTLTLIIVGDGDALDEVREATRRVNGRLGRTAVQAIGSLADPRPAYNAADVVLAMGGAAIRGLAHAKPVIVLGESGFSRVYEPSAIDYFRREGFYGHGSGVGGSERVAVLLQSLAADPDHRAELGAFGLREVDTRFGLDAATTALEAIYAEAIRQSPSLVGRVVIGASETAKSGVQRLRSSLKRVLTRQRPEEGVG